MQLGLKENSSLGFYCKEMSWRIHVQKSANKKLRKKIDTTLQFERHLSNNLNYQKKTNSNTDSKELY